MSQVVKVVPNGWNVKDVPFHREIESCQVNSELNNVRALNFIKVAEIHFIAVIGPRAEPDFKKMYIFICLYIPFRKYKINIKKATLEDARLFVERKVFHVNLTGGFVDSRRFPLYQTVII